jgi:hypothetical protein
MDNNFYMIRHGDYFAKKTSTRLLNLCRYHIIRVSLICSYVTKCRSVVDFKILFTFSFIIKETLCLPE